ncbi:hypothetical protein GCM10010211_59340 [Streptomyces albospinus]|uniref:Uncharacterized protein n=1 Tax=Streptomyces albospinus TaxID=285515 RepID=A0ABQ2VIV4_9ACTN|nr:hypothetical protein GCM10010211_59340 [Streptomyces albospinus]
MPPNHSRASTAPSGHPARAEGTEAATACAAVARRICQGRAPIARSIANSRCCWVTAVPIVEATTNTDR